MSASPASAVQTDGTKRTYLSDQPIQSRADDRFNRWPFAKRIADTIVRRPDSTSLVVGLYGPWGDGKTSVLGLMEEALAEHPDTVVVRFNPWRYGSEQQLLRGFFDSLADALGRSLSNRKEDIGQILKKYGSILSIASVSVGSVVQISPGEAAAAFGEALSSVELDELRVRLERILKESNKRLVILLDDIDRLDRAEVHATFKLVKISASFDYTSYVLAFDDEMVAAALGERYGGGGMAAGRSFLEKIVQVPLHLPPAETIELRAVAFDGVNAALELSGWDLSREQGEAFVQCFVDALEPQMRTPRQAKRYVNALAFSLPLLKGEVYPVDLMIIEAIRVFYPKLYAVIRDNPNLFLKGARDGDHERIEMQRRRTRELVDQALENAGVADKERVWDRLIEILFPRTRNMGYGSEWNLIWAKEQRICAEEYFSRYFSYSVPPGDVGDVEIQQLIEDVSSGTIDQASEKLTALAKRRAMARAVTKLRQREDSVDPSAARKIALAIARNAFLLPREQGMFVLGGTFTQAAILVAHLVRRLPLEDRSAMAGEILLSAEPLPFAAECFRWMRHSEDQPDEKRCIPADEEASLGRMLAGRILAVASELPLYKRFGEDAPRLYWIWQEFRGREEVREAITRWLAGEPDGVDQFLDNFVGRAWGLETGVSQRAELRRDQYNVIAELVDPALILLRLRDRYGLGIDSADFVRAADLPENRKIAYEFAAIHRFVMECAQKDCSAERNDSPDPPSSEVRHS